MTEGRINRVLDSLPRTRLGRGTREVPAFRACAVVGCYLGLAAALRGGLLAGRSLPVVAVLCVAGALSGVAPVYLRRLLTGRERMVLLEGAGLALAGAAATARALGEPVLAYLDVLAPALALCLAAGRAGCLLAGCCHGRPSSLGIVYPEHHVGGGSLAGVRLFPVQAVEAAGLAGIALAGLAALPRAAPGQVLAWFLGAYAVLRFGTEGLRGDRRPHLLGLSAARWTCLAALGFALWLGRAGTPAGRGLALLGVLGAVLAAALAVRRALDPAPGLLSAAHLDEVRRAAAGGAGGSGAVPLLATSRGLRVAASPAEPGGGPGLHLSLSLPPGRHDLALLCEVAARAFPGLRPGAAWASPSGVLHLRVPAGPAAAAVPGGAERLAGELFGSVVRGLQGGEDEPPAPGPRAGYFAGGVRGAAAHGGAR